MLLKICMTFNRSFRSKTLCLINWEESYDVTERAVRLDSIKHNGGNKIVSDRFANLFVRHAYYYKKFSHE